jgi:hypothetical protein
MLDLAWTLFKDTTPGWARVQSICDFVHQRINFGYEHARVTRAASEAYQEGRGVCRLQGGDFVSAGATNRLPVFRGAERYRSSLRVEAQETALRRSHRVAPLPNCRMGLRFCARWRGEGQYAQKQPPGTKRKRRIELFTFLGHSFAPLHPSCENASFSQKSS